VLHERVGSLHHTSSSAFQRILFSVIFGSEDCECWGSVVQITCLFSRMVKITITNFKHNTNNRPFDILILKHCLHFYVVRLKKATRFYRLCCWNYDSILLHLGQWSRSVTFVCYSTACLRSFYVGLIRLESYQLLVNVMLAWSPACQTGADSGLSAVLKRIQFSNLI